MKFSFFRSTIQIFLFIAMFFSCDNNTENYTAFNKLISDNSGIDFSNNLIENDSLNYFTYAYIYMGGGISAGDINNDGLIDLYFTGNMVSNKLYLNKGDLKFEDISVLAGIEGDSRWYTGTTMIDINNDGFLDIYCSVGGKSSPKENQLFINNGDNTFTEQAKKYGIDDSSNSVQSTFFDYDLDGDLDLYVANYPPTSFNAPNHYYAFRQKNPSDLETDRLFKREGDIFIDVTEAAGLKTFGLSLSATVGDVNQDGWPDIYVSNDFSTPDYLFINNKNGTFSEKVKQATQNTSFYGMGVDIADFNNDNLLDIIQVDMTSQINRRAKANMASMNPRLFWSTVNSGFHYQYMQNSLQVNNGNYQEGIPHFSNLSRIAGLSSTDWSWGPLIADLDNDGWKDIFISNGTRREINNRDFFLKIEKKGVHPDSTLEKTLAMPSEKIENYVFKNNRDLTFVQKNKDWGLDEKTFSNGSLYVDLDNDGDLEIVTNNIDDKASIYENKNIENNNFLSLKFNGTKQNNLGLGVKVILFANNEKQFQELTLTRGFQSSVAPQMNFGIGKAENIDSIKVIWPDRNYQIITNVSANSILVINHSESRSQLEYTDIKSNKIFKTIAEEDLMLNHLHSENPFNDFEKEILLPHQTSMFGPNIGAADLNGDGTEDIVVGGSSKFATSIYFQDENEFKKSDTKIFDTDEVFEDMGIHIFDVENDGDQDIYIASGGNEFSPKSKDLQDRLYLNDGKGNFIKSDFGLPEMLTSSSRVYSYDYDNDGDKDLFVAGRLVPGNYPSPTDSYILENKSSKDNVIFENVTSKVAPDLEKIGMVTDAVWCDYDNDGWTDLILVGEWMPIVVLKNENGEFKNVSNLLGVDDTRGWWFSIEKGDFDNDGDMDFVVGNLGLNYKYKATEKETFDIYFNDFDKNNKNDIVLSYYNEGEQFPVRGRECSSQQIPAIKSKFKDYESFSVATLEDVYTKDDLEKSLHYQIKSFASVYLENTADGFKIQTLPNLAQTSCINKILVEDFNKDGHLDALIAGNLHASEVETPRSDAGVGLLLLGNGKGDLTPMQTTESGLLVSGDVKDIVKIKIKGIDYLVVAKNSDLLQFVEVQNKFLY
jgi:hypothetical protein